MRDGDRLPAFHAGRPDVDADLLGADICRRRQARGGAVSIGLRGDRRQSVDRAPGRRDGGGAGVLDPENPLLVDLSCHGRSDRDIAGLGPARRPVTARLNPGRTQVGCGTVEGSTSDRASRNGIRSTVGDFPPGGHGLPDTAIWRGNRRRSAIRVPQGSPAPERRWGALQSDLKRLRFYDGSAGYVPKRPSARCRIIEAFRGLAGYSGRRMQTVPAACPPLVFMTDHRPVQRTQVDELILAFRVDARAPCRPRGPPSYEPRGAGRSRPRRHEPVAAAEERISRSRSGVSLPSAARPEAS